MESGRRGSLEEDPAWLTWNLLFIFFFCSSLQSFLCTDVLASSCIVRRHDDDNSSGSSSSNADFDDESSANKLTAQRRFTYKNYTKSHDRNHPFNIFLTHPAVCGGLGEKERRISTNVWNYDDDDDAG